MKELIAKASKHLEGVLTHALEHTAEHAALVIYDSESELAKILTEGYRTHIAPQGFLEFGALSADEILTEIDALRPGDLVVLVQSSNFRLNEFRFRIELFKRSLKTIEHVHLSRMSEDQFERYIDELNYDPAYYRKRGGILKEKIDHCKQVVVHCGEDTMVYNSAFESTRMNVGDYSQMDNVGGTFPIGEVFSEATDLAQTNGTLKIFAFAGKDHILREYEPFQAVVKDGILDAPGAPEEFLEVLEMIKLDSPVYVRELGLGLNKGVGKGRVVNDVTAFERQNGLHLSLGAKHSIYKKPGLPRDRGGYHIDVFVDLDKMTVDDEVVFEGNDWTV